MLERVAPPGRSGFAPGAADSSRARRLHWPRDPRARAREALRRRSACSRGLDLDVARGGVRARHRARTARARRRCSGSSPACSRRRGGELEVAVERGALGFLAPRAARLPRADRAREPRPLRPALPRARAARADRDAARALRALGRARASAPARSRAGCSSGSRSAARCSTSPSCCCSTSRSTRSTRTAPRCSTASSPSCAGTRTFLVATHDPERLAPLATGRVAFA